MRTKGIRSIWTKWRLGVLLHRENLTKSIFGCSGLLGSIFANNLGLSRERLDVWAGRPHHRVSHQILLKHEALRSRGNCGYGGFRGCRIWICHRNWGSINSGGSVPNLYKKSGHNSRTIGRTVLGDVSIVFLVEFYIRIHYFCENFRNVQIVQNALYSKGIFFGLIYGIRLIRRKRLLWRFSRSPNSNRSSKLSGHHFW